MFLVSSECDVLSSHQSLYFCKKLFQITLASFLLCCILDVVFVCLHVVCLMMFVYCLLLLKLLVVILPIHKLDSMAYFASIHI